MFLLLCTDCGIYMKGPPLLAKELFDHHKCDGSKKKIKESITECKAILDAMVEAECSSTTTSQPVSGIAVSRPSINVIIPKPPPMPPFLDRNLFEYSQNEFQMIKSTSENYAKVQDELKKKLSEISGNKRQREKDGESDGEEKRQRLK